MQGNYQEIVNTVLPKFKLEGMVDADLGQNMATAIAKGQPSFKATGYEQKKDGDLVQIDLKFEKSKNPRDENRYFLNEAKMTVTKPNGTEAEHTFRIFNQTGFNKDQMYNAMEGRHVYGTYLDSNKNEQRIWTTVNLNAKDENGNTMERRHYENSNGFNVAREYGNLPISGRSQMEKENDLKGLRDGEKVEVPIKLPDGNRILADIVAQPTVGNIGAYTKQGERIDLEQGRTQTMSASDFAKMKQQMKTTHAGASGVSATTQALATATTNGATQQGQTAGKKPK